MARCIVIAYSICIVFISGVFGGQPSPFLFIRTNFFNSVKNMHVFGKPVHNSYDIHSPSAYATSIPIANPRPCNDFILLRRVRNCRRQYYYSSLVVYLQLFDTWTLLVCCVTAADAVEHLSCWSWHLRPLAIA